jgi:hypothetical protein
MTLALTIADNADGASATATIAGSAAGSLNLAYLQPFAGVIGAGTVSLAGSRSGDGMVGLPTTPGFYTAYALSLNSAVGLSSTGVTAPISAGIYVPVGTFNAQPYYFCGATGMYIFYDSSELGYILSANMLGEGILGQLPWLTNGTHGAVPNGSYTNTGGGGSGTATVSLATVPISSVSPLVYFAATSGVASSLGQQPLNDVLNAYVGSSLAFSIPITDAANAPLNLAGRGFKLCVYRPDQPESSEVSEFSISGAFAGASNNLANGVVAAVKHIARNSWLWALWDITNKTTTGDVRLRGGPYNILDSGPAP